MYRYLVLLTRSAEDAEDLAAETFERAIRAWGEHEGLRRRPLPWLLLTARRLATDRWRRARRLVGLLPLVARRDYAPGTEASPEFWLGFEAVARVLTDRQREVLVLRYQRTPHRCRDRLGHGPVPVRSPVPRGPGAGRPSRPPGAAVMTMHDDRELQERFERRLSGVDTEIPEPPPISALTGAGRVRVPARAGSASRGPIAVALVAVLAVAVVLLGAPLALRNGQQPAASDGVVQPTPMTAPSAGPTDLGPVDSALEELDLDGVVNGLAGGPGCTLDRPGGYGAGSATDAAGRLVSWHSNIVWVVTCPHAAGDTTLGFLLVDGLRAEIVRLGGTVTGESGWTDDAATAFVPYERSLVILGDATTGVARVMTFDAKLPELRIIVTVDLQLRDEAR